ncbi:hypothetical protein BB559_001689 [Furculomyces boomerangus]|uniref:ABC transporter domain-containing protein n=1 Tax=Furculomyces boomerangus TaxID=61424 RepID=A0A2T9Z145_9FUNG|nr:hypothetical protein BB559_001689 [Furculomyces boomerangus]
MDLKQDSSESLEELKMVEAIKRGYFSTFFAQLKNMLIRNLTLLRRYYFSTIAQTIVSPIVFLVLMFALQKGSNSVYGKSILNPTTYPLGPLDICRGVTRSSPCINLMYYPKSEDTDSIMQLFANQNLERSGLSPSSDQAIKFEGEFDLQIDTPPNKMYGIVSAPEQNFIYNYALNNPNTTAFGITFDIDKANDIYKYQLWFNSTVQRNDTAAFNIRVLSLLRGVDEAIIGHSGNSKADIDVVLKDWPTIPPRSLADLVITSVGPMFLFSTQMVIFINLILMIVTEKEKKLRESMQLAGLKPEVYWLSWYLAYSLLAFICVLVTQAMGYALNLKVFRHTNFFAMFLTLFLFNLTMLAAGCMVSAIVSSSQAAVLTGVYIFIVGLILMGGIFTTISFTFIWWEKSTTPVIKYILMAIPPFNFGYIYICMSLLSAGSLDPITYTYTPGPSFKWANLYKPLPSNYIQTFNTDGETPSIPSPSYMLNVMLINGLVYLVITWYMDNVVPNHYGASKPLYFFLSPKYWRSIFGSSKSPDEFSIQTWINNLAAARPPFSGEDPDVTAERKAVLDTNAPYAVRIVDLNKVFKSGVFSRKKFTAVDSTCLGLQEGEILALLGQNGAGKSTTMNILSGVMNKTAGDALFYGVPLNDQRSIRSMLGICPQHDILFDELNAVEHVKLYAGLKGLPQTEIDRLLDEGLYAVRLLTVRNKPVRGYSGGMKRRLSVLIATIGNPKIAFFDEPTTGMDPVNRRHVWRYLERFKRGRVIILTSHSMEEADVLSDRVAVMAHGKIRALGSSIRLKNRFGVGYRFSMIASNLTTTGYVKDTIAQLFPQAQLEDDSAGALIYHFDQEHSEIVPEFISWLEQNQDETASEDTPTISRGGSDSGTVAQAGETRGNKGQYLISTWGMSQTSLEEVFLKLVREAQEEQKLLSDKKEKN